MVETEYGGKKFRIALLGRNSKELDANPENQEQPLTSLAQAMGGEIVKRYFYYGSGGSVGQNDVFLEMLNDADKHEFDLLLFWSLDRFSREGISNTLGYLERLKRAGVKVKSLQEPWLDTRDEGLGQLLLAIFSWVAQQERKRIVERTKAGLARAKREGKILGRPKGKGDSKPRSKSGYQLRYAGKTVEERKIGKRR